MMFSVSRVQTRFTPHLNLPYYSRNKTDKQGLRFLGGQSLSGSAGHFRALGNDSQAFGQLKRMVPKLTQPQLTALAVKIEQGNWLSKGDRLLLTLIRLAEAQPVPANGTEAFNQLADVFKSVAKETVHPDMVVQWHQQSQSGKTSDAMVDEAFQAYNIDDPKSTYDQTHYPPIFAELLKPPAQRYNKKDLFKDKDVITQLSHITIIDRQTGAVEIQEVDPAYKSFIPSPKAPLLAAIIKNRQYFKDLPNKTHCVIYQKPGRQGETVWQTAQWQEDRW